ncbi:MAG: hypothetical protein AMJ93_16280, partial [Anaerolineae bacterium SM23_84]
MARRLELLAGAFGVLLAVALMLYAGVDAYTHPANYSPSDRTWVLLYMSLLAGIGLLHWVWRGRLLLVLDALAVMSLISTSVVRAGTGLALVVLVWLITLSGALGNHLLECLVPSLKTNKSERLLLGMCIGFGGLALLTFTLAALQLLYRSIAYALLIGLTLWLCPGSVRRAWPDVHALFSRSAEVWRSADLRLPAVVVGCVSVSLLGALLWALAPAIDFDALLYHLSVPAFYVQQHGLVEVAERYQSYWAHNVEMLYTLALLLADQPLPTLINWTIGLLTAGLVFALGRRVGGARTGMAAVLLFCSTPIVARECGIAVNDMGVSLFSFGAVYCAAAWWQEKDDRWLIFVGLLAGLAVGTKLSATLMLVPLFLCLALGLLLRHGPSKRAAVGLVHVALPAAALVAPWLVRDWLWTGNPIFPFRNTLFRSPQWPVENVYHVGLRSDSSELLGSVRSPPDLLGQLLAFVRLAWYLVRQPGMFSEWVPPGFMGGLPVLALPWVGLGQRQPSPKRRLLLYAMFSLAVVVTLLWWQVLRYLRHLLQLLPLLAVLAAMNLEALWLGLRNSRWGRGAATLGLLLALCYVAATRVIETVSNWQLLERYPYRLLLGLETRERFLSRTLPAYDALQFLNRTGDGEHKVLSIDSSCWLYTMSRVYAPGGSPEIDR